MGGGIRGNRHPFSNAAHQNSATLDKYKDPETDVDIKHRVFISFHSEDEAQVDLLRQQAKNENSDLNFTDYSIKEPFDEKWKTRAAERINRSSVFICMIGPETYKRDAVIWEINKAYELGKKVIGVRIYRDENHIIPQPLKDHNAKIMNWDLEEIAKEVESQ